MNDFTTRKRTLLSPEQMKAQQASINEATRSEANKLGWGTQPPTFPEVSGAPVPSHKGSCRKKRRGV